MNGIEPACFWYGGASYLANTACCAAVSLSSFWYRPFTTLLLSISRGTKLTSELFSDAPEKLSVGVLGYTSFGDEVVSPTFCSVPKRDSAVATAHRSAAQYGQYSAPMYRISGLPLSVSAGAVIFCGAVCAVPVPTVSKVDEGTDRTLASTAADAALAVGPFCVPDPPTTLTMISTATTTTIASTALPTTIHGRRRRDWARRSRAAAERCAAEPRGGFFAPGAADGFFGRLGCLLLTSIQSARPGGSSRLIGNARRTLRLCTA